MTTASLMRRILLAEAMLYAVVVLLLLRNGVSAVTIVLVVALLALSGRALVIAGTYACDRRWGLRVPSASRVGWPVLAGMVATEYFAYVFLFSVVQPFEKLFMGADRSRKLEAGRLPVLLVHGYQCNRGVWYRHRSRLEREGWVVATINLEPVFTSIDDYVEPLHRRVEELCAETGAQQVMLVGHSMGGLVSRAYLRAHGPARVARLITLGTPHHGSRLAALGPGVNARQMLPGSEWLAALNTPGATPLPPDTVSARSAYDNYVMPQDSPCLPGARDADLGPVGHQGMLLSGSVTRFLIQELARP